MNVTFLESMPIFGHLIAAFIIFYPFAILFWLFSWGIIIRHISKTYHNAKRRKAGALDNDLETTDPPAVGWAVFCILILSLSIGTYRIVWQGTSNQVEVYSSVLLEKSVQ